MQLGCQTSSSRPTRASCCSSWHACRARDNILELGTLAGYSTIWLARALPEGGRLVSVEINPAFAETARESIARAGLSHLVDIRLGKAIEVMPILLQESLAPFDFIFIDADKPAYPEYLEWSLKLCAPWHGHRG